MSKSRGMEFKDSDALRSTKTLLMHRTGVQTAFRDEAISKIPGKLISFVQLTAFSL